MYVCVHMFYFFFLCTLGALWANYSAAFPEEVWQCCNAAMLQFGKNTVLIG